METTQTLMVQKSLVIGSISRTRTTPDLSPLGHPLPKQDPMRMNCYIKLIVIKCSSLQSPFPFHSTLSSTPQTICW